METIDRPLASFINAECAESGYRLEGGKPPQLYMRKYIRVLPERFLVLIDTVVPGRASESLFG